MRMIAGLILILSQYSLFAEEQPPKYALVIGNSTYSNLIQLVNPTNDADDITVVLEGLGFVVDKVIDGSLSEMEDATLLLKERLASSPESYGFLFYAGHGVQSGGENYLIPVDADIPSENFLRQRALSVQSMLYELNDAGNSLNVVVLDACRDNPFSWGQGRTLGLSRGLAVVNFQPADSIIVFATSAGQRASDGTDRNGLFTAHLLRYLSIPDLEVKEVFNRTGADVSTASERQQVPAIYNQFFGTAYLGSAPDGVPRDPVYIPPVTAPRAPGGRRVDAAKLWSVGVSAGSGFGDPLVVGTARGTIAPLPYFFAEAGVDVGALSTLAEVNLLSFYPYLNLAAYIPLYNGAESWGGVYAGIGAGYMLATYYYPEGETNLGDFAVNAAAGMNLFDFMDVSLTVRFNLKTFQPSPKFSVGYIHRF